MDSVFVSSDPYAWLRPYYRQLSARPEFRQFAPSHQFEELLQVVQVDHPSKAAEMREWSVGAQHSLVAYLAMMSEQKASGKDVELWKVSKGYRELRCVTHYLPTGIDVRLLEGDGFKRTQLCRDAPEVRKLAADWQMALTAAGWSVTSGT